MSEAVAAQLFRKFDITKFSYLNHVIHNRSDYFIGTHISRINEEPNIEKISLISDIKFSDDFGSLDLIEANASYLRNQKRETLGVNNVSGRKGFLDNIRSQKIDIIIFDNYMDIASKLVISKSGNSFFALSGAFSSGCFSKNYDYSEFLDGKASRANWSVITAHFHNILPDAEFYFIVYPPVIVGQEDRDSVVRSGQHSQYWADAELTAPLPYVHILFAEPVQAEFVLNPSDWAHYKPEYYEKLGAEIILNSGVLKDLL